MQLSKAFHVLDLHNYINIILTIYALDNLKFSRFTMYKVSYVGSQLQT